MSPDVAVLLVALAFVLMGMVLTTGSTLTTCVFGRKYVGSPLSGMLGYDEVVPAMLPVNTFVITGDPNVTVPRPTNATTRLVPQPTSSLSSHWTPGIGISDLSIVKPRPHPVARFLTMRIGPQAGATPI